MKILIPILSFALGTGTAFGQTPVPIATAVLDFQTADDSVDKQGADVATLLEADLSSENNVITVERQDFDKIIGEQNLTVSGLTSSDTAAKIGSLTGAQVLVTGRLFSVGGQNMVVAKVMSTETSRVYGVTETMANLSNMAGAVQDLAGKIGRILDANHNALVARQETDDQRLQRLRKLVTPGPLPSVTVNISERDYTQPTIDPAAQTEMMKILQQLGFQVIDANNVTKKADILISGEAFSESGSQHGNLVSSIGRIELKAVRSSTGDLLLADRETRVGVDAGNRTAGKDALQRGAQILLERLLPKLTK